MAPIRYSLHYEDYSEHLMSRFGKLLQMQSLVDMTLMCSSHTLRVHKAVLAASSAYFQDVLQKQTGEPLIILKMRFSVLKCLVEFMYCGKTQCLEENLDELVSAAQFLKIKGLSKVTKEGLGITNRRDLPVFTPPVVINQPPQSLIDLHSPAPVLNMDSPESKQPQPSTQMAPATSTSQSIDSLSRPTKRPGIWERDELGRAAERVLLRREQDSRKAIHQLKHLQSRHMQVIENDYMERVSLSQAVSSICGPESTSTHNYMNIDNDLMYMDQTVSSNVLDSAISYSKEHNMANETITSSYSTAGDNAENSGISNAMSQYVNALKSAGLPTDLPILFESGDGSYINVNEQVLLDMVQSSEIQYEVIEQPNIIEKVADPSEIKSIDDLSKSIERGEILMGSKGYSASYDKDDIQYTRHDDGMNSLNEILPDNLESFAEQQNFVVLDPRLQESNNMVQANDFSCIDGDMQFFTKSMSDDVKKYYEEQQLNDARVMEQLCPTSTTLDTNFNSNMCQQYQLNPEDLRRNEDCYDFGLQLPQTSVFKEDELDCLMSTPKRPKGNEQRDQERDEIIQDLMNIEKNMNQNKEKDNFGSTVQDFNALNVDNVFNEDSNMSNEQKKVELPNDISSSGLHWENIYIGKENEQNDNEMEVGDNKAVTSTEQFEEPVIDLTTQSSNEAQLLDSTEGDKENVPSEDTEPNLTSSENDIPFAVGLLPLKQVQPTEDNSLLKRNNSIDDLLDNIDAKCLKRKVKYKKL